MEVRKETKNTFTYRAKPSVVKEAKIIAAKKNNTISAMIEAYLERLIKSFKSK